VEVMDNELIMETATDFDDFVDAVAPEYQDFVYRISNTLTRYGYNIEVEESENAYTASFEQENQKILDFQISEKALFVKIYCNHLSEYSDFLASFPIEMLKEIAACDDCRRATGNPELKECCLDCKMCYDFFIGDKHFQKCRLKCFRFKVTGRNIPVLRVLIEQERMAIIKALRVVHK
jgi:uncharacterized protein YutD